jgi:hypothetical protein
MLLQVSLNLLTPISVPQQLIRTCCVLLVFTDGLPRVTILMSSQAMYKESMLWVCNKHICLDLQVILIAVIWMLVVIKAWCCLA